MQKRKRFKAAVLTLVTVSVFGGSMAGCELLGGVLSFARIISVQLPDEAAYTVAFQVEGAVANPSSVEKVNWVFGDGSGFVEGPAGQTSVKYQYAASGTYAVTAFVFDANGLVAQVHGTTTVVSGDGGPPVPEPGDLPDAISGASPRDEAQNVPVDVVLMWTGSEIASSYDVYLWVLDGSGDGPAGSTLYIFRGGHTETEFDPEGLMPDTQFYWRVDAMNEAGVATGDVLGFTTAAVPEVADDFVPADGAGVIPVAVVLEWTAGENAASHDVYFGGDAGAVARATPETADIFQGSQTGTTFDPEDEEAEGAGELLSSTTYYWRIDEVGPGGTATGEVLQFTTTAAPPQVTGAVPTDGAMDVDVQQNLSWLAAPSVTSFDVYLGLDEVAVGSAARTSPEFRGNQTAKVFDAGPLLGETGYYWRIDCVGAGGTTQGDVLRFTTAVPPPQATGPFDPPPDETNVRVDTELSWGLGGGGPTTSFDIYLSTDEAAVNAGQASAFQGNQAGGLIAFDPDDDLTPDTDYFWRIDAVGPGGTTTGPVLRFRTAAAPHQVDEPDPANGETGVAVAALLMWAASDGATTSYKVYLGTDEDAVRNADENDAEFKEEVTTGTTFTPTEDLNEDTDYFWRVDASGFGGVTQGEVWSFRTAPGRAGNPTPLHGETDVGLDTELGWAAGDGAVSHDVYFGTVEADVLNATPDTAGIFKGNQTETTFDPGDLDGMQDYFWRIDEVGEPEDGTTKGEVWEFTTRAGQAAEPIDPPDGAAGIGLDPTLVWNAGSGAVSHDIYFGTDESAVDNATRSSDEFQGNQLLGDEMFTPAGPLDGDTPYYWRIDEIDIDDNVTKGEVWQFHTGTGRPSDPRPEDEETGIDVNTELSWTAGSGAVTHDVYLGTDEAAVTNATPASGAYQGSQAETTFTPDTLDGGTPYYWRIDEIGPGGATQGEVWSFTTGPGQATNPTPADGVAGVDSDQDLSWTVDPGAPADSHDVYFGTSAAAVAAATRGSGEFRGNQAGTSFDPGTLDGLTWYHWRIDELDAEENVTKGEVWQFRTEQALPDQAGLVSPFNGAADVPVTAVLNWSAASGADSYDVYLGIDDPLNLLFQRNQTGTSFNPEPDLLPGRTYYWRIDTVNEAGTTEGVVWFFTTEP